MAYNTKSIKKDVDGKPIPQYFNPAVDDYEVLQGRNGANRVELYGPDGNPLSSTSGKLNIRASELETLLSALGAKDFATQTTLAQILAKIIPAPATEAKQDALIAKDFATETTLAAGIVSLLSAIAETASETTAAAILAKLEAGIDTTLTGSSGQQVSVTNNKLDVNVTGEEIISAPVVGVKTVVATAAELFAGASAKVGRRKLVIKNEDQCLRLRVGPSTLTQQNGYPIEPGAIAEFKFDPNTAVPIYAISEGAAISVAVWEV